MSNDNRYQFPHEPLRFTANHINDLLSFCTEHDASDITIQTNEAIFIEVYGRLQRVTRRRLSHTEVGDILNAIYGSNGTTQLASGIDVDTHYEFKPSRTERFRYRVNATGCQVEGHPGIQITLRTIPTLPPLLSTMDLPDALVAALTPDDGVVYVTGSTGSGKSTLLAAIIRSIAEDPDGNRKILTYEAPIEFVFDDIIKPTSLISQAEIPRHLPSFAAGVRNALRRKPRLILVGEARDTETLSAVTEAALTGHPVYTTLHSSGVAETIRRLVNMFPHEERHSRVIDIIETLRVIIWQKLVPTLKGHRVALREYLIFNEFIRDQLLDSDPNQITAKVRDLLVSHGQPMLADAQAKFDAGIISERNFALITTETQSIDRDLSIGSA